MQRVARGLSATASVLILVLVSESIAALNLEMSFQPNDRLSVSIKSEHINRLDQKPTQYGIQTNEEYSLKGMCFITFRVSRRPREMYCGQSRLCVCLSVCLSAVRGRISTLLHGPGCNLGEW